MKQIFFTPKQTKQVCWALQCLLPNLSLYCSYANGAAAAQSPTHATTFLNYVISAGVWTLRM